VRDDARQNRERILAAAEVLFAERGATASTEEVARRAGVGIGTVFRHFPTKNALIDAALVRHFADLTDRARSLAEDGSPGEALHALLLVMIETGPTKIALLSLAAEYGDASPDVLTASHELRAVVDVILRRAQKAGQIRADVTIDEVYFLVRSLAQSSASAPVPPSTLQRAAEIVATGLRA
jgi:AcrR family transcriptional regulator